MVTSPRAIAVFVLGNKFFSNSCSFHGKFPKLFVNNSVDPENDGGYLHTRTRIRLAVHTEETGRVPGFIRNALCINTVLTLY